MSDWTDIDDYIRSLTWRTRVRVRWYRLWMAMTREHAIGFIYGAGLVTMIWCVAGWLSG